MSEYLRSAIRCDYRLVSQVSVTLGGEVLCESEATRIAEELRRNEELLRRVDAPPVTLASWPVERSSDVEEVRTAPTPVRESAAKWKEASDRIEANRRRQLEKIAELSRSDEDRRQKAKAAAKQCEEGVAVQVVARADNDFMGPPALAPLVVKTHPLDVLHQKISEDIVNEVSEYEEKFTERIRAQSAQSRLMY